MAVIDHITTNNSATYEIQDTVARTKSNNLESTNYTDIGGGFADGNTLLVKTDNGMKKGFLNNFANWILDKLATKVYNQLATSNKTMIGALNELNSKRLAAYARGTYDEVKINANGYALLAKDDIDLSECKFATMVNYESINPKTAITIYASPQRAYVLGEPDTTIYGLEVDFWK